MICHQSEFIMQRTEDHMTTVHCPLTAAWCYHWVPHQSGWSDQNKKLWIRGNVNINDMQSEQLQQMLDNLDHCYSGPSHLELRVQKSICMFLSCDTGDFVMSDVTDVLMSCAPHRLSSFYKFFISLWHTSEDNLTELVIVLLLLSHQEFHF